MPKPYFRPISFVTALVLPLSVCAAQQVPFESIPIDSVGVQIVTSDPANSDAICTISEEPVLIIGEDEEDENQWFSMIRGMGRLSDGSIVAVDRMAAEVRIYDETGRHLRSTGGPGEGPGEFLDPFILWITPGDTLWVGNTRPWRYNVFTAQGQFVRRVSLSPAWGNPSRAGGVLDNGYTVNSRWETVRRGNFAVPDTLIVEVHDPSGELVGSLARIPNGSSGTFREAPNYHLSPLFQSFAEVDARGSTIVLAHGSEPEVRVLDDEFNLRTIIRWFEPDRKVTSADVRAWRKDYVESRTQGTPPDMQKYVDADLRRDRPVADVFPAISSVVIGRDGRIWVRQYDRPREDRGWLAFGADGEFICHMAQLPGSVWEFGAEYLLLLHRSELGIQTVQMHRLATHP